MGINFLNEVAGGVVLVLGDAAEFVGRGDEVAVRSSRRSNRG